MNITSKMYELGGGGKLVEIDRTANNDLPVGTLLQWEGYGYDKEVIVGKTISAFDGVAIYTTVKLDDCSYRRQEAYSLKPIAEKKDHRIAVYILPETLPADDILTLVQKADALKQAEQVRQDAHGKERAEAIERGRKIAADKIPAAALALIVAECDEDQSDSQSDYFSHKTTQLMVLATSKHTRDNFAEMRKAAARFEPTQKMGPGLDKWTPRVVIDCATLPDKYITAGGRYYRDGETAPWYTEYMQDEKGQRVEFTTRENAEAWTKTKGLPGPLTCDGVPLSFRWDISAESYEHRDKYSGGSGYYLKDGWTNATGWRVRKAWKYNDRWDDSIYLSLGRACIL